MYFVEPEVTTPCEISSSHGDEYQDICDMTLCSLLNRYRRFRGIYVRNYKASLIKRP
jgi:hypothetical protein